MLIRLFISIFIWGGIYTFQGDFASLVFQVGVLGALILLLTGTTTRLRLVGSLTLATITTLGVILWPLVPLLATLPTTPETAIPENFNTYTSEGFFSISYPPDWEPNMAIIKEVEEEIKLYLEELDIESQADDMQLVFIGGKKTDNWYPVVAVTVEPRQFWPLGTLVENTNEWSRENIEQYVERSRIKTTIGGREAIIQTYQGADEDSVLCRYTLSYVVGEKFLWCVTCVCDSQDFGLYLDTFDNIVRSLRVEY